MQCEFEVLLLALSLSLEASCLGVMLAAWCVCVCGGVLPVQGQEECFVLILSVYFKCA